MLIYPLYKSIKLLLGTQIPVFFYLKQYEVSKDNTSYRVPAIYIEMPQNTPIDFWGKKLMGSKKNVTIKIHYISHAPFKNHNTTVQDSAIAAHSAKLIAIDTLLNGIVLTDTDNKEISEELILTGTSEMKFLTNCIVSVLSYTTTIYTRHLQI